MKSVDWRLAIPSNGLEMVVPLAVAIVTAAALSACGGAANTLSGSTGRSTPSGAAPSISASSSTGTTPPVTATSPHPGAPVPSGPAHCTARQLHYQIDGGQGAAGTINVGIRVTNAGPGTCWTYGYPGLQILDAAGHPLPTVVLRGTAAGLQVPLPARLLDHPQRVTLHAGSWGWFDVAYNDVAQASVCPTGPTTGARLTITAPDTTTAKTITLTTAACGGRLGVSPILPASTWTQ